MVLLAPPASANLLVRGDIGTWAELALPIGDDGVVLFRLGRALSDVHRDMIFSIVR